MKLSILTICPFLLLGLLFGSSSLFGQKKDKPKKSVIMVYYFHPTLRCSTCLRMEKWTREIIEAKFKKELKKSILKFQSINIEEEKNLHHMDDYLLASQAIIVSKLVEDKEVKWKELENIWFLKENETNFKVYIEREIKEFLKKRLQPKIP